MWLCCLEVDDGFEGPSCPSWDSQMSIVCDWGWVLSAAVSREVGIVQTPDKCRAAVAEAKSWLLVSTRPGLEHSSVPHIWKRSGTSSQHLLHRWNFQEGLIC